MTSIPFAALLKAGLSRATLVLTVALAFQSIAQAATVTILPSPPGVKRSASEGQTGYTTENFDAFSIRRMTNGETGTSAIGNWTATGANNNVFDGSTSPVGDGRYIGIQANSSITFTLNTQSRYIGFYSIWVSPGNTWTFYDSTNTVVATLDSSTMVSLVGTQAQNKPVLASDGRTYSGASYYTVFPNQSEASFYVNLQLDDPTLYFSKVVFSNGPSGGNEFDNVTISAAYVPPLYTIGGSVSGLDSGKTVVLQNNAGDSLTRNANGVFSFSTAINAGSTYDVTVSTQPTGQTCTLTNGSGTAMANVTNVTVTCTNNPTAPIPTLSEWAMIFMASLMAMFGIRRMRRQ